MRRLTQIKVMANGKEYVGFVDSEAIAQDNQLSEAVAHLDWQDGGAEPNKAVPPPPPVLSGARG